MPTVPVIFSGVSVGSSGGLYPAAGWYTSGLRLQDIGELPCLTPQSQTTPSTNITQLQTPVEDLIPDVYGVGNGSIARIKDGFFSTSSSLPSNFFHEPLGTRIIIGHLTLPFSLSLSAQSVIHYVTDTSYPYGRWDVVNLAGLWALPGELTFPGTQIPTRPAISIVDYGSGSGAVNIEWTNRVFLIDGAVSYEQASEVEVNIAGNVSTHNGQAIYTGPTNLGERRDLSEILHTVGQYYERRFVSIPLSASEYPVFVRFRNQWDIVTSWRQVKSTPIIVLNTTTPDDVFFQHDARETYAFGAPLQTFRWQLTDTQDPGDLTDNLPVDVTQSKDEGGSEEGFAVFEYDYQELAESTDSNSLVGINVTATTTLGCSSTRTQNSTVKPDPPFIGLVIEAGSGDRFTAVQEGNDVRVRRFDRDGAVGTELPLIAGLASPTLLLHTSGDAPSSGDDEFGEDSSQLYLFARKRSTGVWALYTSDNGGESFNFMSDSPFNSNYKKARPCDLDCGGLAVCAIKKQTGLTTEIYFSMSYDGINWEPVVYVGERGESIHKTFFIIQEHATNSSRLIITNGVDKHFVSDSYGEDWEPLASLSE